MEVGKNKLFPYYTVHLTVNRESNGQDLNPTHQMVIVRIPIECAHGFVGVAM